MLDGEVISLDGFLAFLWVSAVVMTIVFVLRAYIRRICFGHILLEDWLVAGALAVFISISATYQVYLKHIYDIRSVAMGTMIPGPTFMSDTAEALRAIGALSILVHIGLWLIKASFLVLFYRIGSKHPLYLWVWWAVSAFVLSCGVASLGLIRYQCFFNDIDSIVAKCMTKHSVQAAHKREIAGSALDVVSDVVLIAFPVWILWHTRLSLRQKIVFSGIFFLVSFTISIAIVRGVYSKTIVQDRTLWFYVEYVTSFMVACAISFRSLFVQHRNKLAAEAKRHTPPSSAGQKNRFRYYFDKMSATLVSTAHFLEGHGYDHDTWKLPMPESGLMTVDFSHDEGWQKAPGTGTGTETGTGNSSMDMVDVESLQTFKHDGGGRWDNTHATRTMTTTVSSRGSTL